jgi:hypothetical protein
MGNHSEITSFLLFVPDSLIHGAVSMLELLPDKDLRDTKAAILVDHLYNSFNMAGNEGEIDNYMFLNYILNPRISNEIIVAWRGYFRNMLPSDLLKNAPGDPSLITYYLVQSVKIAEDENYYGTPLTPRGVNELGVSDNASRSICFVAICRTMGIPSRLEPGTNVPQYFFNKIWNDVYFTGQMQATRKNGFLKLQSSEKNPVPEYYIHFTLARFENGRYNTLEYDFNKRITDFKDELSLPSGDYMIVTGRRIDGGKVLSDISFFTLAQDEHKTIDIKLRKDGSKRKMLGKIDLKAFTESIGIIGNTQLKTEENGVVIIWVEPNKEPSRHIFYDLPHFKTELDAWGGPFLFLSGSIQDTNVLNKKKFQKLPANSVFGFDSKMNALNTFAAANNISDLSFPLVVVADNQGNILNVSAGYRIGTAEMILKQLLTTVDI